ncbi:MAG: DUF5658 family protein [Planctomycetota bacterium]
MQPSQPHEQPDQRAQDLAFLSAPPMRYQAGYLWLVLLSAVDVMFTWHILRRGGLELNPIARLVIDHWDLPGAIAFKFALVLFVIVTCEIVGRKRDGLGRALIGTSIGIASIPVAWSLVLLATHGFLVRPMAPREV